MIPVVRGVARMPSLGGLDDVVDLTRGNVMQHVPAPVVITCFQVFMHGIYLWSKQGIHVAFLGTVGMHLDEHPFRAPLDVDTCAYPVVHPVRCGRATTTHVGILDARHHPELAFAPVETQRSLHNHQVAASLAADPHWNACVM